MPRTYQMPPETVLNALPPRQALTAEQIARRLGCYGTAYHRAMKALRVLVMAGAVVRVRTENGPAYRRAG